MNNFTKFLLKHLSLFFDFLARHCRVCFGDCEDCIDHEKS